MEYCTMSSMVQICSWKEPRSVGNLPPPNPIRDGHHFQQVSTQQSVDFYLWFSSTPGPFVVWATILGVSFMPQLLNRTCNSLLVHQPVILTLSFVTALVAV